jgi:hypothetical protein
MPGLLCHSIKTEKKSIGGTNYNSYLEGGGGVILNLI